MKSVTVMMFCAFSLAGADQPVSAPVLGYVLDAAAHRIRPVYGIPGASALGQPLEAGVDIAQTAISPRQDYAIYLTADAGQAMLAAPIAAASSLQPLDGVRPGADRVVLSPQGSAAVFYYASSQRAQVVSGLPDAPSVVRELDLSALPDKAQALTVSDDGGVVLASASDAALYVFGPDGAAGRLVLDATPSAMTFLNGSEDALLADPSGISIVRDPSGAAVHTLLAAESDGSGRPVAIAASADNTRAFVADAASGSVIEVDLATGSATATPCDCVPAGLYPMSGRAAFRLTELGKGPMILFDGGPSGPRVVLIPPASEGEEQQ